jgi:hypothetical protein
MNRELLQQALDAIYDLQGYRPDIDKAIAAIKQELAKPEQEPVAWAAKSIYGEFEGLSFEKQPRFDTPLYALEGSK